MNTQRMIREQTQAFAAKRAAAVINGKPEPLVVSVPDTLPPILSPAPDPTPRVEPVAPPKRPWDLRLHGWAWNVVSHGIVRSFLLWGLGWYPKVRSCVHAVCSRRVTAFASSAGSRPCARGPYLGRCGRGRSATAL